MGAETPTPPRPRGKHLPVNRIIDRCENITFPQLRLRVVTRSPFSRRPTARLAIDVWVTSEQSEQV